jgi:hypothetical protein
LNDYLRKYAAIALYIGIPKMIFKGNVMPKDIPIYKAGLTSGIAWRKTAGTAI